LALKLPLATIVAVPLDAAPQELGPESPFVASRGQTQRGRLVHGRCQSVGALVQRQRYAPEVRAESQACTPSLKGLPSRRLAPRGGTLHNARTRSSVVACCLADQPGPEPVAKCLHLGSVQRRCHTVPNDHTECAFLTDWRCCVIMALVWPLGHPTWGLARWAVSVYGCGSDRNAFLQLAA